MHGPANPREERRWADEHGVRVFSMAEIERRGIVEVTREAMAIAWKETGGVYVSIDIDCLDAAYNPGGAPEPGGLTSRELFAALREVAVAGYSAFDVRRGGAPVRPGRHHRDDGLPRGPRPARCGGCWPRRLTLSGGAEGGPLRSTRLFGGRLNDRGATVDAEEHKLQLGVGQSADPLGQYRACPA